MRAAAAPPGPGNLMPIETKHRITLKKNPAAMEAGTTPVLPAAATAQPMAMQLALERERMERRLLEERMERRLEKNERRLLEERMERRLDAEKAARNLLQQERMARKQLKAATDKQLLQAEIKHVR